MIHQLNALQKMGALLLFLVAAAYYVGVELHIPAMPIHDTYAYFMPNILHAVRSFWHWGNGLFWNPFQSAGGPFFANLQTGVLYPPHVLFLVFEANLALHLVLGVNMVLGAAGMLLFMRELGLGWVAALGGALAFEIGAPMAEFTGWDPMTNGSWAWVPWALLCSERLLRSPSREGTVCLAIVLALQLLPGVPLISGLTCQVIAFRAAWEIATRRERGLWHSALSITIAISLVPLLTAVQLFPFAEFAAESIRVAVPSEKLLQLRNLPIAQYLGAIAVRAPMVPFLVAPILFAAVALFVSTRRRLVLFYAVIGLLYALLALGDLTPLLRLYVLLPPGGTVLNVPQRLFWVTGLSLSVLTALGLEALAEMGERSRLRWLCCGVVAVLAAMLYRFAPGGLRGAEMAALAGVLAVLLVVSVRPRVGQPVAWLAAVALTVNLVGVPLRWKGALLPSTDVLWTHAATFAALRDPPLTAQDRVFLMPTLASAFQLAFMQRTPTVLRVPSFSEYEVLPGRRYVHYLTMMRKGTALEGLTAKDFQWMPWLTAGFRRRLLDVAAIRYLMTVATSDSVAGLVNLPRVPVPAADLHVYVNETALPRARYLPRLEVIPDEQALLKRLAYGDEDLTAVALVEESLPSGFAGTPGARPGGAADFVTNDPEHLVIDVDAPGRGFLFIADQYYPGWRATVNGAAAPILRANYLFRLIEVPAGPSRVELRYRPTHLVLGAAVSATTALALVIMAIMGRRRPDGDRAERRESTVES